MQRRIVFVHIPKAGGTSLSTMLVRSEGGERRTYPGRFIADIDSDERRDREMHRLYLLNPYLNPDLTPASRSELNVVSGHFSFAMARAFGDEFLYFSMFRDPVSRVVSHLRDLQFERGGGVSLAELYREQDALEFRHIDNLQTRIFSSTATGVETAWHDLAELDESALEISLENLSTLDIIGVTEHFSDTVRMVGHMSGRDLGPTLHLRRRRSNAVVPDDIRLEIETHNRYDVALYAAVLERFREQRERCEADGLGFE